MSSSTCAVLLVLASVSADAAPAPLKVLSTKPASEWNALFAGPTGWIGGDGVFSVPLGNDRVLWLFGDTLYGRVDGRRRVDAVMVNNSLAITGRTPAGPVEFPAFRNDKQALRSALVPPTGPGWYWPISATLVEGRLVVFAVRIDKSEEPGVFGFRMIGQSVALIANPEAAPSEWKIEWLDLPNAVMTAERQRSWGMAVVRAGDWLYLYGVDERIPADPAKGEFDRKQLVLARVKPGSLTRFESWEYLGEAGWSGDAAAVKPLLRGLANEYSVTRLPDDSAWLLVYSDCGLSSRVLARLASSPDGPWSDPTVLVTKPEVVADKGLFGYNGKAHPWACRATGPNRGTLLINYSVNSWDFGRLFQDETVYRPRFVTIEYERQTIKP